LKKYKISNKALSKNKGIIIFLIRFNLF